MNKKRKTLFVALLSIFTTAGIFAACNPGKDITEIPADKDYGFTNPTVQHMPPDEGYTIDGVLDEYKNSTWIHLTNDNGNSTVNLSMTSHYGEKGMYFAYDVTESTPIYVNPSRASYINSGIEMYLAPNGVTTMSSENIFEIDLVADGTLSFKRNNGISGQWAQVHTTYDKMAYLAAQPKGGEINTDDCYGYTLEFFLPWDYLSWLGLNVETMKQESVYVNPVHITSYNYEGTDHTRDRYWYSFATQLGGDGWGNVGQYFRFGANGAVGTVPITFGESTNCTLSGPEAVLPGLPATVTVTPEKGYAITSFKCDNAECVKFINYNEDGSATYTVYGANSEITFSAQAEAITAGKKTLSGKINLKKAGGDTYTGMIASYFDADGEHDLPVDANGMFSIAELAQGFYTIYVEKQGYGSVRRGVYLGRDTEIQIDFEFGAFDTVEGTCWDILNANDGYIIKKGGRGAILSKNSYGTFYAEANFRYDEALASKSNADDYYQQRIGFRIKFSEGKYWHPDVMCEGGSYKVTYGKILGNESIFNWDTVHTMNAKQIAKYKSEEGIKLGILRVGTTAYIYLDGELVATSDLGAQGIKADETAQIGFEGYVNNDVSQRIDYIFKDKNANEVILNDENSVGGSVAIGDNYKIGENVVIVLGKNNATDVLLSLLVDGEEMSNYVVTESDGTQTLTLTANKKLTINVTAVYGEAGTVTANIAVDGAWKANGVTFTLTNKEDGTEYTATVANNKMTVENMKKGLYSVKANVFGAEVDMGWYSVVSGEEKLLEVEKVFVNGKALDPALIDLSNGNLIYHSAINESYSLNINAAKGDAYLAAKVSLTAQDKATLLRGGEVSFGMFMTVEDDEGELHTHWVDFWIKNAADLNMISMRTDFGWGEDFCKPFTTNVDANKYSKALFGDGLYVVLRYNSATGVMETYFGDKDYNVAYLRDWNDAQHRFPANGKVTSLGFRDNLDWGGTAVTVTVEGLRYGRTLPEALGVAGKTITVTGDGEKENGAIHVPATQCGNDVTITLAPANGYKVASFTVNGEAVAVSELVGGRVYTIRNYTGAALTVDATFEQTVNSSVDAAISGKKLGSDVSLAGKTVTLSGNGSSDVTATVNGDGRLVIASIATGTWTLKVEGYYSVTITVAEDAAYDTAIVLDCDTFYAGYHVGDDWTGYYGDPNKIDKSHVNDADPYFTVNSTDFYQYTNDTYTDVIASFTVNSGMTDNNPTMGLVFDGNKAVMLRIENMKGKYKVQWIGDTNWLETSINGNWDFGAGEEFYNPISSALQEKYESTGLKLSLLRKGDKVYAFVDDVFVAMQTISGYADKQCRVMYAIAGVKGTQTVPFSISSNVTVPSATVENKTTDTNGTVTVSKTEAEVGSDVTVRVTANEGYVISTLKVNGVDVTEKLSGGEYTFTLNKDTEVVATFEEVTVGSVNAEVTGKKHGVTGNALTAGTAVTLISATAGEEHATLADVDGKTVLKVEELTTGKWTVNIDGYLSTEITVTGEEYSTAIALEFDLFDIVRWDEAGHDLSCVNDASPSIKWNGSGTSLNVVTNETVLGNAAVSVNIKTAFSNQKTQEQGLLLRFEDGKAAILNINIGGTPRLQYRPHLFDTIYTVFEKEWVEFNNVTAAEVEKYNSSGIELKVVRNNCELFAFIDNRFVGKAQLPEKYEHSKMGFGFFAYDVKKDAEWKFAVETDELPALTAKVTDKTTDTNGKVTLSKTEAELGSDVTVKVEPNEGYIIGKVTVNGVDVTDKLSGGEYTFALSATTEVEATFEEIVVGSMNSAVSGKRLGAADLNGLKVTLKNSLNEYTGTVSDGKLEISNIIRGTYKVSTEYTIAETEIAVEANTEYTEAIDLTQLVFIHNLYGDKVADSKIDYTHVFDENGYVAVGENGGHVYEFMPEAYGNVVFSTVFKKSSTTKNTQAIGFVFGDYWNNDKLGAAVRIEENFGNGTAKFQWQGDWEGEVDPGINFGKTTGWQDFNDGFNPISSELKAKYAGEGITVTIVRNGTTLDTYLDGVLAHRAANVNNLTADMKVYPFIATKDATANSKFYFSVDKLETAEARITVTPATGISVTTDKTSYSVGEEATITVSREEGYVLDKIQIGARCYDKLEFNENAVATVKVKIAGNVAVKTTVSQATMTKTSLESNVFGRKYGSTDNLEIADGTAFKVFNNNFSYLGKVTGGKISIPSIANGTYTIHVEDENYVDNTVTVGDTAYTSDIALAYLLFTSAPASADLSKIDLGKVTATGNGGIDLVTKESYTDFTAEAVFDVPDYNSRRYSISLVFDDGKNFRVDFAVQDNGSNIIQQTNWSSMMFNWEWVNFPEDYFASNSNSYTEAEIRSEFIEKGLTYKLERTGSTIKLYINGVLMKTYELTGDYANKAAQLRFIQDSNGTDGTKGFTFDISVPEV